MPPGPGSCDPDTRSTYATDQGLGADTWPRSLSTGPGQPALETSRVQAPHRTVCTDPHKTADAAP